MLSRDQEKMREAAKAAESERGGNAVAFSRAIVDFHKAANPAAILALLDQVEAQGWQPIATAPKDGTAILLYTADGQIEGYWEHRGWEQSPCYATYDGAGGVALISQPTHYRPLPPPPEAA